MQLLSLSYDEDDSIYIVYETESDLNSVNVELRPTCPPSFSASMREAASQTRAKSARRVQYGGATVTCIVGSSSEDEEDDEDEDLASLFPSFGEVLKLQSSVDISSEELYSGLHRALDELSTSLSSFSQRFVVLGYCTARHSVYLLPDPVLIQRKGQQGEKECYFASLPLVEMTQINRLNDDFRNITRLLEEREGMMRYPVALPPSALKSPPLDASFLAAVFTVQANTDYFLKSVDSYVKFVGVSMGVPWVTESTESPSHVVSPLLQCFKEKSLIENFELCDPRLAPSPPVRGRRTTSNSSSRSYTPRRHCILGKRTSSPRPPPYTTSVQGNLTVVTGPFGNPIQCQQSTKFGFSFPERVTSSESAQKDVLSSWASSDENLVGKAATVMGVYHQHLVLLFDGHSKATVIRCDSVEAVKAAFVRLDPALTAPRNSKERLLNIHSRKASKEVPRVKEDSPEPHPGPPSAVPAPQTVEPLAATVDVREAKQEIVAAVDASQPADEPDGKRVDVAEDETETRSEPLVVTVDEDPEPESEPASAVEEGSESGDGPEPEPEPQPEPQPAPVDSDRTQRVVFAHSAATISLSPHRPLQEVDTGRQSIPSDVPPIDIPEADSNGHRYSPAFGSVESHRHSRSTPFINFLKAFAAFRIKKDVFDASLLSVTQYYSSNVDHLLDAQSRYRYYCSLSPSVFSKRFEELAREEMYECLLNFEP